MLVEIVALGLFSNFLGRELLTQATVLITHDHTLLLWKRTDLGRLCDVVLEAVDLDLVVACDHVRLVYIDVGSLLVCREDDLVVDAQWARVLQDHSQVLGTLHVVLATVVVVADVRDLLVDCAPVVPLPLVVVVLVAVVLIWVLVVLLCLCDLEDDLILLLLVQVIWIDQLELRVMADVIVLVNLFVFLYHIQSN